MSEQAELRFFDLGLAKGIEVEHERIIKLLKEMAKTTFPGDVWHINPFEYAIAIVEGEAE